MSNNERMLTIYQNGNVLLELRAKESGTHRSPGGRVPSFICSNQSEHDVLWS